MIKKRTRPQARQRLPSPEPDNNEHEEQEGEEEQLDLADLIELRKLRRAREGIDISKLSKGDIKKKKRKREEEGDQGGLKKGADIDEEEEDEEGKAAKARRAVRSNNFTQQTNVLDVDKHMMAYIEENMKKRRGEQQETKEEDDSSDPYAELFRLTEKYKATVKEKKNEQEEGSVTNSMAMLTAIPEVDLGMDTRLKNIEETEKAKRIIAEERKERRHGSNTEEHLAATRFYRPNLKPKSDADIMRDAKLEAMGLPPEDYERRPSERNQMATDELVMERFKKRMRK
ncbi:TLS1 family protein [Abortiporus biennis]